MKYKPGWVYFARATNTGRIKIGHTTKMVWERLQGIRAPGLEPVEIIARFPGSRADEKALHKKFAHCSIGHEWFSPTSDLMTYIDHLEPTDKRTWQKRSRAGRGSKISV